MIYAIIIICLINSLLFSPIGIFSSLSYAIVIIGGLWKIHEPKSWYLLSIAILSVAFLVYLFEPADLVDSVVHKLSDWTILFLAIGTLKLAFSRT